MRKFLDSRGICVQNKIKEIERERVREEKRGEKREGERGKEAGGRGSRP
jgi:hypothetical protein